MSTTSSTAHVDASSKEALFRTNLVPTGQVLEVYLRLVRGFMSNQAFVQLAHDAYEALTVAATFIANPDNREDATELSNAIAGFSSAMRFAIAAMGQKGSTAVAGALKSEVFSLNNSHRSKLEPAHTVFYRNRQKLLGDIVKAAGYDQTKRSAWLEQYAYSVTPTPLLRNAKVGRWRTFVRNTDWSLAIELMGATKDCAGLEKSNSFSSVAGIQAASELWRDAFDATDLKEREAALPATAVEPAAEESWLPMGVHVKSATGGRLLVSASFDPKSFLTPVQCKQLKAETGPETLRTLLRTRSFEVVANVKDLAGKVDDAAAWLEAQKTSRDDIVTAFEAWQHEVKLQAVRAKLQSGFNAEERALLAKIFADEAKSAMATTV